MSPKECESARAIAQDPVGFTYLQPWPPESCLQRGADTGRVSHATQRNGETALQMETGRAGLSEPSLTKSEGRSCCAQRIYQKVNSNNVSLSESSGTRTRN